MMKQHPWSFKRSNDRNREIQNRISYKFNFSPSKSPLDTIQSSKIIANALAFSPSLFDKTMIEFSNNTILPKEDNYAETLAESVDLATLTNDSCIRSKLDLIAGTLLIGRKINPTIQKEEIPSTLSIRDGTTPLIKFRDIWDEEKNLLISNQHASTILAQAQIEYIRDNIKVNGDTNEASRVLKEIDNLANPVIFNTNNAVISKALEKKEQYKIAEIVDTENGYKGGSVATFEEYCRRLYSIADKELKKTKEEPTLYEYLAEMDRISVPFKLYGIQPLRYHNLYEKLVNYLYQQNLSQKFDQIYDIIVYLGYQGLFYLEKSSGGNNQSNINHLFQHNPFVSPNYPEIQDSKNHNNGQLFELSNRLFVLFRELRGFFNKNTESDENISSYWEKKKSQFNFVRINEQNRASFEKYQKKFKEKSYRYVLNFIGGQQSFLFDYIRTGKISFTIKNTIDQFRIYMEIQYLLHYAFRYLNRDNLDKKQIDRMIESVSNFFYTPDPKFESSISIMWEKFFQNVPVNSQDLILDKLVITKPSYKNYIAIILETKNWTWMLSHLYKLKRFYSYLQEDPILKREIKKILDKFDTEIIQFYGLCIKLRFFFRSHHFNVDPVLVDFLHPDQIDSTNIQNLTRERQQIKFGVDKEKPKIDQDLFKSTDRDFFRTYKIGLGVPVLADDFTYQMRKQQILKFYNRNKNCPKTFENFKEQCLKNGKKITDEKCDEYKKIFTTINFGKLSEELDENETAIANLKKSRFTGKSATSKYPRTQDDIPVFFNPEDPKNMEEKRKARMIPRYYYLNKNKNKSYKMTLKDYQYLTGKSWEFACRHQCIVQKEDSENIPLDMDERERLAYNNRFVKDKLEGKSTKFSPQTFKDFPEHIVPICNKRENPESDLNRPAYPAIIQTLNITKSYHKKLEDLKELFYSRSSSSDFIHEKELLMCSYSVPKHLKHYLAQHKSFEGNQPSYIRNRIVGWRRKMDSKFSCYKLQLEDITSLNQRLASIVQPYIFPFSEFRNEHKILRWLQKRNAVHLLFEEDFDENLFKSANYRMGYSSLRSILMENLSLPRWFNDKITSFSIKEIGDAANIMIARIRKVINELEEKEKADNITIHEKNNMTSLEKFIERIELFKRYAFKFKEFFKNCLPGNKFFHCIKDFNNYYLEEVKNKKIDMYTAIRGVLATAFAKKYPKATAQFEDVFTPENCITGPYKSKMNNRKFYPITLSKSFGVVHRSLDPTKNIEQKNPVKISLNRLDITEKFKKGESIWIGMPIYPSDWVINGIIHSKQGSLVKRFWYLLKPSQKIIDSINNGAEVGSLRINPPQGPTKKIVVDIILKATSQAPFRHQTNFIKEFEAKYEPLMEDLKKINSEIIGSDWNTLGKFILALATPDTVIELHKKGYPFYKMEDIKTRMKNINKHIANLQRKRDTTVHVDIKTKMASEFALLRRKIKTLRDESKKHAIMVFSFIVKTLSIKYVGYDNIRGLEERGKKGKIAIAITNLPKDQKTFQYFCELVQDLQIQYSSLPSPIQVIKQIPYTSQICPKCGKIDAKHPDAPYKYFWCKHEKCGYRGGRDGTSARVSAQKTLKQVNENSISEHTVSTIDREDQRDPISTQYNR